MISLHLTLTNAVAFNESLQRTPGKPWEQRESVLIASTEKTIPELIEEGMKIVSARPGVYTSARVGAELLDNDGVTLGDYWPTALHYAIVETDGKISFKGVN
jgi:hypothetical protein